MNRKISIAFKIVSAGLALSCAMFGMAGCSTFQKPELETPAIGQNIPSEWLLELTSDAGPEVTWPMIYKDPVLVKYIELAMLENFDIKIAQSRIVGAEAELKRASARLKPRFDIGGSGSVSAFFAELQDPFDSYGLSVSGRWDPDLFGQSQSVVDGATANLHAQEALSEDVRQAIIATTARAYIRAVEAKLQVDLAKTNLEFLTESRRISEARYRLGDTAKGDFSFAEANYQSALASYESTVQSARAARRALSILLGGYPEETIDLASTLYVPNGMPPRGLPAKVLERRPDIIAARAQLAGRIFAVQGAELAKWPSLDISGGLSGGSSIADLFDPAEYIARLGAGIAQVLLDDGSLDAGIESAKANLDISLLAYEQRLRRALGEITDAYDRAETLRRTLVNLEASSRAANEALRLESIQFDLGESSLLDVLQVQTRVNNIDASLIRTKAALIETGITANESIAAF